MPRLSPSTSEDLGGEKALTSVRPFEIAVINRSWEPTRRSASRTAFQKYHCICTAWILVSHTVEQAKNDNAQRDCAEDNAKGVVKCRIVVSSLQASPQRRLLPDLRPRSQTRPPRSAWFPAVRTPISPLGTRPARMPPRTS